MSFLPKRRYCLRHSGQFFTQVQVRFSSAVTEMLYILSYCRFQWVVVQKLQLGIQKSGQKVYVPYRACLIIE